MKKRVVVGVVALAAVVAAAAWYWPRSARPEEVRLPGTVEVQEVRLGSRVGGRVAAVHVRESQVVEPGTVMVTFEAPELTAKRDQAKAKLEAARAALDKANRGPLPEEIAEAKAATDSAEARLARMKAGFREEEKAKARADLAAAKAEVKEAEEEYGRAKDLLGVAGSRATYDAAVALRDRARERLKAAEANHALVMSGNRPEDIAEMEADAAKFKARYDLLKRGTREEDKAAAYAETTRAEAELAEAEANLREAAVVAPERCVVEVVSVRAGSLVPAGQPVVLALRADDLWVKAFVPATDLGKLRLGQPAEVAVDSHPGRRFPGEVVHIATVSEFTPRNVQSPDERKHQVFAVKVRVTDPGGVFKSGMAAEVFVTPAN